VQIRRQQIKAYLVMQPFLLPRPPQQGSRWERSLRQLLQQICWEAVQRSPVLVVVEQQLQLPVLGVLGVSVVVVVVVVLESWLASQQIALLSTPSKRSVKTWKMYVTNTRSPSPANSCPSEVLVCTSITRKHEAFAPYPVPGNRLLLACQIISGLSGKEEDYNREEGL
jgi:hypothetical protein